MAPCGKFLFGFSVWKIFRNLCYPWFISFDCREQNLFLKLDLNCKKQEAKRRSFIWKKIEWKVSDSLMTYFLFSEPYSSPKFHLDDWLSTKLVVSLNPRSVRLWPAVSLRRTRRENHLSAMRSLRMTKILRPLDLRSWSLVATGTCWLPAQRRGWLWVNADKHSAYERAFDKGVDKLSRTCGDALAFR